MVSNIFKTLNLTQLYLSPLTSSVNKKNITLLESKVKPITSTALYHTKNRETKILKPSVTTGFCSEDLEERKNSP